MRIPAPASYARSRFAGSLLAVFLLPLPSVAANDEDDSGFANLRPSQLHSLLSSDRAPLLLDVRTSFEYAAGHIAGAVNIPHTELEDRLSEVRAASRHGIALYCMSGARARVGENHLRVNQIGPLYHLEGGYLAWKRAGYSVERTERPAGDGAEN